MSHFSLEEILNYYHSFLDDKKSNDFFESIVFTELGRTDKITSLIDRYIFKEINNLYTEFMAKELISIEEKEQKKKKKERTRKIKKMLKLLKKMPVFARRRINVKFKFFLKYLLRI